jgi:hypothetical protein
MKDIVNEYMKNNRATDWFGVERLHCNDGFSMSVQAHEYNYCSPRRFTPNQSVARLFFMYSFTISFIVFSFLNYH